MEDLCPICLSTDQRSQNHHVIARIDGGCNHKSNLIQICASCHALISFGNSKDANIREIICIMHQFASYGLLFALQFAKCLDQMVMGCKITSRQLRYNATADMSKVERHVLHRQMKAFGRKTYIQLMRDNNRTLNHNKNLDLIYKHLFPPKPRSPYQLPLPFQTNF